MHAENAGLFISLSYVLQAAKDILYWKGNASPLRTVLIVQCRFLSGCRVTVPDCSDLFFDSTLGKQKPSIESFFFFTVSCCSALSVILWLSLISLCCLLSKKQAVFLYQKRSNFSHFSFDLLIFDPLNLFYSLLHPTPCVSFISLRLGDNSTLNAVHSRSDLGQSLQQRSVCKQSAWRKNLVHHFLNWQ